MRYEKSICVALLCAATVLSGCASFTAPAYAPDYETIDRVKRMDLEKLSVGEVQPRDPRASVNSISLRGSSLSAAEGTYAAYLEKAIRSDLAEMGLYDAASAIRLDAVLLKNDLDTNRGTGVMEVKLSVNRKGGVVLDKLYTANTTYETSFAGAIAIPKAQSEYPVLVRTLLRQIYTDPAFIEAIKK